MLFKAIQFSSYRQDHVVYRRSPIPCLMSLALMPLAAVCLLKIKSMDNDQNIEPMRNPRKSKSHIWGGVFILAIGGLLLARQTGAAIPDWVFTWQMALIAIGLFSG